MFEFPHIWKQCKLNGQLNSTDEGVFLEYCRSRACPALKVLHDDSFVLFLQISGQPEVRVSAAQDSSYLLQIYWFNFLWSAEFVVSSIPFFGDYRNDCCSYSLVFDISVDLNQRKKFILLSFLQKLSALHVASYVQCAPKVLRMMARYWHRKKAP